MYLNNWCHFTPPIFKTFLIKQILSFNMIFQSISHSSELFHQPQITSLYFFCYIIYLMFYYHLFYSIKENSTFLLSHRCCSPLISFRLYLRRFLILYFSDFPRHACPSLSYLSLFFRYPFYS